MADRNLSLGVETDDSSLNRAKRRLEEIEKSQDDLRNSFKRGERDVEGFTKELGDLEKEARQLNKALDALEEPRRLRIQGQNDLRENLADTSGTGASRFAQTRGAVEVLAGSAGEAAGPILEAAEGIADIGEVAVATLGPAGVVVAIAAAGFALFVNNAQQAFEDVNAIASSRLKTEEDLAFRLADGTLTLAQAQDELADAQTRSETATRLLKEAEGEREQNFADRVQKKADAGGGIFSDFAARLEEAVGAADNSSLDEAIARRKDILNESLGTEQAINEIIETGSLPREEAIKEEKELSAARSESADAVSQATSAAGSYSAAVQSSAQSAQSAASSITSAFDEVSKASERRIPIGGRERTGRITASAGGGSRRKSSSGADSASFDTDSRNEAVEANKRYNEAVSELTNRFNEEQLKEERRYLFDLERIRKQGKEDESDALRTRNFAQLAQARKSRADAINEFKAEARFQENERQIAYDNELRSQRNALRQRLSELQNAERQALAIKQQGIQASLMLEKDYWASRFRMAKEALSGAGGFGGNSNNLNQAIDRRNQQTMARPRFGATL